MIFSGRLGWIGVDVGTHTVKLAQTVRTPAGVRLHRAAVVQRPASWSSDDGLAWEQPIASSAEIKAALQSGGFTGRNAICTLPMNLCELRGLTIPPGDEHERRAIIADELADDWSQRGAPSEFDFWPIEPGQDKTSEGFNVNVLSASRPWITQVARDCRQAGLYVWAIDGAPSAMSRAVALASRTGSGRRALAVDWGYSNTTLSVVGEQRTLFARRAHGCSFRQVLDSIAQSLGISDDEAQHLADTEGVPIRGSDPASGPDGAPTGDSLTQTALANAAMDTIDELVGQIKKTLHYVESQRRSSEPATVWLLGGGASLRNIGPLLADELGLAVRVWKLPLSSPIPCAARERVALFAEAAALSASAWRAA